MNQQAGERGAIDHDAPDSPESKLLGSPLQEAGELAKLASPLTHVTADDPPMLLVHGTEDRVVPWQQSDLLHKRLRQANVRSTLKLAPGAGHGGFSTRIRTECYDFFDTVLQPRAEKQLNDEQG